MHDEKEENEEEGEDTGGNAGSVCGVVNAMRYNTCSGPTTPGYIVRASWG